MRTSPLSVRFAGWARDLASPFPVAAVLVLLANDHVAKHSSLVPAWLSGKASDIAGLFFFPLLLTAIVDGGVRTIARRPIENRVRLTAWMALLTAVVFTAIKLDSRARFLLEHLLGSIAPDPTDLVALPMLALAVLHASRAPYPRDVVPLWARASTVLFAASASIATSQPQQVRSYPVWFIDSGGDRQLSCGVVSVWISSSGKTGAGLTVRVTSQDGSPCAAHVEEAILAVASGPSVKGEVPGVDIVASGRKSSLGYVPFLFDEEEAWNDGHRTGTMTVRLSTSTGAVAWTMPIAHRRVRWGPNNPGSRPEPEPVTNEVAQ